MYTNVTHLQSNSDIIID